MSNQFSKVWGALLLGLSLAGCQPRPWAASPSLGTTDVPVNSTIAADQKAEAFIAPYRQQVTEKMSEVIGYAPAKLNKGDYQSPLGNFVVDLQLAQSQPMYNKPINLSLTTNGGLRQELPQGDITVGDAFELMPFENELVVLTLNGSTVQKLFNYAAQNKWAPLGGATYTVENGQPVNIRIGGKPFDEKQTYTLVTSDYLAGGGDDLVMLKEAVKTEKVGLLLRNAIIKAIKEKTEAGKPVTADTTARVFVLP